MGYFIGLDLGGTNIKSCVIDQFGKVLAEQSVSTDSEKGPDAVVGRLVESAERVAEASGLKMTDIGGIGIGAPGPLDPENGVVINAPNIPGFVNVPLVKAISEATGVSTVLENDANAAGFGEFAFGAGRDPKIRHLAMLTLGTGVGGGVIIDGKVLSGAFGRGAELGHMIVHAGGRQCPCGQKGCLERYTSATATENQAIDAINAGRSSCLKQTYESNDRIEAREVFDAAKQGDAVANAVVDEVCHYLGLACVNICRIFDPQMIVFAGGMIHAGDILFDRVQGHYDQLTWTIAESRVQIVPATLGNQAGRIGAAAEAMEAFGTV